jgi:hypothetical protein
MVGDGPWWELRAYTVLEGYKVQVTGTRLFDKGRLDGEDRVAIPFFAPLPPTLEELETAEGQAAATEWWNRCLADDW